MIDSIQNGPKVIDSLSAPMVGHKLRIVTLGMEIRNSHMRNVSSNMMTVGDKFLTMINPVIEKEPGTSSSHQYEFNFCENKKIKNMYLVLRDDFVNVKFLSINGQRHHMILPFRESRLLQFHMSILNGAKPFNEKSSNLKNVPKMITEQELHDEEFIQKHSQYLNMMKDVTKTQRI